MKWILAVLLSCMACPVFSQAQPSIEYDTIYTKPDVLASFPGGEEAWKKYVKKNLKYPKKAWWDEVESEVQVKLIIEKDGKISGAQHMNISNYGFEQEAVRLVLKSGKWRPAIHRGRPVKSEGLLTIHFRLR